MYSLNRSVFVTFINKCFPLKTAGLESEILNGQGTYAKIRIAK